MAKRHPDTLDILWRHSFILTPDVLHPGPPEGAGAGHDPARPAAAAPAPVTAQT